MKAFMEREKVDFENPKEILKVLVVQSAWNE